MKSSKPSRQRKRLRRKETRNKSCNSAENVSAEIIVSVSNKSDAPNAASTHTESPDVLVSNLSSDDQVVKSDPLPSVEESGTWTPSSKEDILYSLEQRCAAQNSVSNSARGIRQMLTANSMENICRQPDTRMMGHLKKNHAKSAIGLTSLHCKMQYSLTLTWLEGFV